jgi:hypothetical protein
MLLFPLSALNWDPIYTIPSSACFFIIVLAYAIVGFIRGWKRELVSLLFYIIAFFLLSANGNQSLAAVIARLSSAFSYAITGRPQSNGMNTTASFLGPWASFLIFILLIAIGYYLGNKAFPMPTMVSERLLGILPALIEATLVISFLNSSNFFARDENGQLVFTLQPPDPAQFLLILFVIGILATIGALIAAGIQSRKSPAKK